MNMKKLILGALLVVGATSAYAIGGKFEEVGVITSATDKLSGGTSLDLESTGTVMDITENMVYLQLKPKANTEGDADTLNFNFGKVIKGTMSELSAKYEARLFIGTAGGDGTGQSIENLKPVQFDLTTGGKITLGLITDKSQTEDEKFGMLVVNELNNPMGILEYKVGTSGLTDNNYAYTGDVLARLYTAGSTIPSEYSTLEAEIGSTATGTFTAKAGKFTFEMENIQIAGPNVPSFDE